MTLSEPLPFDNSDDFEDDLRRVKDQHRRRFETAINRCDAIRERPYKGEPKTEKMAGLYGEHVSDHWVILYQLIPNLPAHADATDLDLVYFHRYIHHDGQEEAVRNVSRAEQVSEFEARLSYEHGANSIVSELHDCGWVELSAPEYREEVFITGAVPQDRQSEFEEIIPDGDEVSWTESDIRDLI